MSETENEGRNLQSETGKFTTIVPEEIFDEILSDPAFNKLAPCFIFLGMIFVSICR